MKETPMLKRFLLSLVLLAGLASGALAQQAVPVTPTATLGYNPQALCSATAAVANQVTCTVAVGNLSAYVTGVFFDVCTNATGTAQNNVTFTSTGITSTNPSWTYSIAAAAEVCQHWGDANGFVLFKSQTPGVNVVITSPASATNNNYGIRVYGYLAP